MALLKETLKAQILAAFQKQAAKKKETDDPAKSAEELADDLASAIDAYIKTATVNTTVTGASPSGPVTGTGVGSLT